MHECKIGALVASKIRGTNKISKLSLQFYKLNPFEELYKVDNLVYTICNDVGY
jgi:hypothetical protein